MSSFIITFLTVIFCFASSITASIKSIAPVTSPEAKITSPYCFERIEIILDTNKVQKKDAYLVVSLDKQQPTTNTETTDITVTLANDVDNITETDNITLITWDPQQIKTIEKPEDLMLTLSNEKDNFTYQFSAKNWYKLSHFLSDACVEKTLTQEAIQIADSYDLIKKTDTLKKSAREQLLEKFPALSEENCILSYYMFKYGLHYPHNRESVENTFKKLASIGEKTNLISLFNPFIPRLKTATTPGYLVMPDEEIQKFAETNYMHVEVVKAILDNLFNVISK